MMWMVTLTVLTRCNHTECLSIGNWLEYAVFDIPDVETVRMCIANNADHTLEMSAATTCPGGAVYTCFDCVESDVFRGCGTNKCGGRHAGICLGGRCECYPGFVFSVNTGACEIDH
jgi:hypothetical protein